MVPLWKEKGNFEGIIDFAALDVFTEGVPEGFSYKDLPGMFLLNHDEKTEFKFKAWPAKPTVKVMMRWTNLFTHNDLGLLPAYYWVPDQRLENIKDPKKSLGAMTH
jgi:hypothetical protein